MNVNLVEIKKKIVDFISERGPSLPVHLTKVTDMNLTFTSAILSELLAERKLKLSNLKVGSSSLYFVPGQEERLEGFIENLKEPERDAFIKLKENKLLDDEKQDPVLRVALRSIRDFAVPLKNKDKLYWKYHLLSDKKAAESISDEPVAIGHERVMGQKIWEDIQKQQVSVEKVEEIVKKRVEEITKKLEEESQRKMQEQPKKIVENIFEKAEVREEVKKEVVTKKVRKKVSKVNLFLEDAKRVLEKNEMQILEVLKSDKNRTIVTARKDKEFLVIVSNKKKLDEKELMRDIKKYGQRDLPIKILAKGEPPKKLVEKLDFYRRLDKIERIEEQ